MMLSTFQPSYFPSLEYFWKLVQCDQVILTDHFQYTKRSPMTISAPLSHRGLKLRIPLQHDHQISPVSQKQIALTQNWQKKHYQTLYHLFHHEPYGYYYLPRLKQLLFTADLPLARFLLSLTSELVAMLSFKTGVQLSSTLPCWPDNNDCIIQWCRQQSFSTYLSEALTFERGWLNRDVLIQQNIKLLEFLPFPREHIFTSNQRLSIVSFLMHFGPEAGYVMRQYMAQGS